MQKTPKRPISMLAKIEENTFATDVFWIHASHVQCALDVVATRCGR